MKAKDIKIGMLLLGKGKVVNVEISKSIRRGFDGKLRKIDNPTVVVECGKKIDHGKVYFLKANDEV